MEINNKSFPAHFSKEESERMLKEFNEKILKEDNYDVSENKKSGFFDIKINRICRDTDHNFPTHLYIPPGKGYRHVCPSCGNVIIVYGSTISLKDLKDEDFEK